jgi:adenine-specific DNA-methyltransferase
MPSLNFKGKALVQNFHLLVPFHELKPVKAKSLTGKPSLHDNLVVHGDNLKALKALLPYYHGAVKCIYIDPPYNTGNEAWVYNDKVNSPMMQEWLGKVVDREDLTRHDKWLCMMMPRLKLLREMLTDDGVIFVSVDDNEVHRLRELMDEVFAEENFVAQFIWQKMDSPSRNALERVVSAYHEYVLCYARSAERVQLWKQARESILDAYPLTLPDGRKARRRQLRKNGKNARREDRPTMWYPLAAPDRKEIWPIAPEGWEGRWVLKKTEWERRTKEGLTEWIKRESGWMPYYIEVAPKDPTAPWSTLWTDVDQNRQAQAELTAIMGTDAQFQTPKPSSLVRRIVQIATEEDDIVLDAFAGSGTTAHAVLAENDADGGGRSFVLVESGDFADATTAERVRRVIKGVPKAKDEALQKGLGGTFTFVEVGNPMHMESLLKGNKLPSFEDLAGYVFYTATGEDFDERAINKKTGFIGTSALYDVYLLYEPDLDYLKTTALTLDMARELPKGTGKRRLVFAPTKYLDAIHLEEHRIDFCQLPFEIYKAIKPKKA